MIKPMNSRCAVALCLIAGLSFSSVARATWSFGGTSLAANSSVAADASGISITNVSGAYAANGGSLATGASGTSITSGVTYGISGFSATTGTTWTAGNTASNLQFYTGGLGGLGMASDSTLSTAPNNAIDNGPSTNSLDKINGLGNTEAVMLSFTSSVKLSSIDLGYVFGDSDFSLFRFGGTGAATSTPPSIGGTATGLVGMNSAGWQLVGNYNGSGSTGTRVVNSGLNDANTAGSGLGVVGSSWWLITAYNSSYIKTDFNFGGVSTQGNDFFKVLAVSGAACTGTFTTCGPKKVPEPGSLALISVGLLGALGLRRRRNKLNKP